MRKVFGVLFASALVVLGVHSRAEAAPVLTLYICQDGVSDPSCQSFTSGTSSANTPGPVTIGDYTVFGIGSSIQQQTGSNSQTSAISVSRTGSSSANPLNVWLIATGYTLPVGPTYELASTLTGTETANFTGGQTVAYTTWIASPSQAVTPGVPASFPPVAGYTLGGTATCNIPTGGGPVNDTGCTQPPDVFQVSSGGNFSLVTRMTFNINQNNTAGAVYQGTGVANVTTVPEPASLTLLGTGLLGLGGAIRRRLRA